MIYIKTYGCTLNQADSNIIKSVLENSNYEVCDMHEGIPYESDDVFIINTCAVKKPTQQKILYELQSLEAQHMKVIATGCLATASPDLVEKYAPSASIVSISNIDKINDAVDNASKGVKVVLNNYKRLDRLAFFSPEKSVVAKIPISDGCLSSCSFCETKYARGVLNSFPEEHILQAIRMSIGSGAKEIELTSQDTGAYGADKNTNIIELLEKVSLIKGNFKVRLGMMNPQFLDLYAEKLYSILNSSHFYSFIHIPVQSGSDKVLKDMRRFYKIENIEKHINALRDAIKDITIETDIIVGFPGESDDDFNMTIDFIKRAKPDVTNISKFGAMPHADASKMQQLDREVIKERSIELSRLVRSIQAEANNKFIGSKVNILITESNDYSFNGRMHNYKQVVVRGAEMELGSNYEVSIEKASSNVLYGRLI